MKNIFIIAGMSRAGTTFLYYTFLKHPVVFLPYHKEISFFSYNYNKGLNWYKQLYQDMREEQVGVDITPIYSLDLRSIERIKKFNPDIKVILIVRKPSDWALSFYNQYLNNSWQTLPFEKFVVEGYQLPSHLFKLEEFFIIETISQYRETFEKNLLLCDFSLLQKEPLKILLAIEHFTGLPPYFTENNVENIVINAGNHKTFKVISYVLRQKPVISLLGMMPQWTVHFFHNLFLKSQRKKSCQNAKVYTPENIQLAKQIFSKDDIYVQELFSQGQVLLGDGSLFDTFL